MLKLTNLIKEYIYSYDIYCDMDGVLSDFDKQLAIFTGIKDGRQYEKQKGTEAFWDQIDKGGLKYWSEMPWMSDGKTLWSYLKNKNVKILSAPAKTIPESSRGKHIWVFWGESSGFGKLTAALPSNTILKLTVPKGRSVFASLVSREA